MITTLNNLLWYSKLFSQGSGSIYHCPLCWCLHQSWSKNGHVRCATTRSLFWFEFRSLIAIDMLLFVDFNQRLGDGRCRCCRIFSSIRSSYIHYQCRRCSEKYSTISSNKFTQCVSRAMASISDIHELFLLRLGTKSLQEILSDRESIAQTMQVSFLWRW